MRNNPLNRLHEICDASSIQTHPKVRARANPARRPRVRPLPIPTVDRSCTRARRSCIVVPRNTTGKRLDHARERPGECSISPATPPSSGKITTSSKNNVQMRKMKSQIRNGGQNRRAFRATKNAANDATQLSIICSAREKWWSF